MSYMVLVFIVFKDPSKEYINPRLPSLAMSMVLVNTLSTNTDRLCVLVLSSLSKHNVFVSMKYRLPTKSGEFS